MRRARIPGALIRSAPAAAALMATVCLGIAIPSTGWGQGFTLPDGALTPITQFRLNYRTADSESSTEVSGVSQEQTASELEGASGFVGIAIEPVIFGGSGSVNDFKTETTTFTLEESRRSGTVFGTLPFVFSASLWARR